MNPLKKYAAIVMKLLTDRMPRKVAVALLVLVGTFVLWVILFPTLGGFHDDALGRNDDLKASIGRLSTEVKSAGDDKKYILDNKDAFDDLMRGERLIPHTRGVATAQLQKLAVQRNLTALSYSFSAASSGTASPRESVTGGYRVQFETVDLKLGAALDTQVMDFVQDLGESFPGAIVVQSFSLERAAELTTEALNGISRGQDSGVVKGNLTVSWRTAQAQDPDKKDAKKGAK